MKRNTWLAISLPHLHGYFPPLKSGHFPNWDTSLGLNLENEGGGKMNAENIHQN